MHKHILRALPLLAALALLATTGCSRKAEPEPSAAPSIQPTATVAAPIAETESATSWAPVCFAGPFDYSYQDACRAVAIRRFEQNGIVYFVADVQLSTADGFRTQIADSGTATLTELVSDCDAVLAINADDYGVHKYGTIIHNGTLLRAHETTRSMLIVDANGDLHVRVDRSGEDPQALGEELLAQGVRQSFEFGPELVRDGQPMAFPSDFDLISTSPSRREPRTAIGQIGELHYAIVVADGRQEDYSIGMTLPELQQIFVALGAQTAMNLDGGGSSELWFRGQILNSPCNGAEHSLSDVLYF